jgi:hypothetical protein
VATGVISVPLQTAAPGSRQSFGPFRGSMAVAVVLASGLFDQVRWPMDSADTDVQYSGKYTGHNVQCTMFTVEHYAVEGEMQMCSAGAGGTFHIRVQHAYYVLCGHICAVSMLRYRV